MSQMQIEETVQVLTVKVGDKLVAIPTSEIMEVRGPLQITRVPLSPIHIAGVVDLRGTIIPVVDAGIWLGLEEPIIKERRFKEDKDQYAILVVRIQDGVVGIVVSDIIDLAVVELLPKSEVVRWEGLDPSFILAGIDYEPDVVPLIDPESVKAPQLMVKRYRPPVDLEAVQFTEEELQALEQIAEREVSTTQPVLTKVAPRVEDVKPAAPPVVPSSPSPSPLSSTSPPVSSSPPPVTPSRPPTPPTAPAPPSSPPSAPPTAPAPPSSLPPQPPVTPPSPTAPPTSAPPSAPPRPPKTTPPPTAPPAAAPAKPAEDERIKKLKSDLLMTPGIQSDAPLDALDFPELGGEPLEELAPDEREFELNLWTKDMDELLKIAEEMGVDVDPSEGKFTVVDKISQAYRKRKS